MDIKVNHLIKMMDEQKIYARLLGVSMEEIKDQNQEMLLKISNLEKQTCNLELDINNIKAKMGITIDSQNIFTKENLTDSSLSTEEEQQIYVVNSFDPVKLQIKELLDKVKFLKKQNKIVQQKLEIVVEDTENIEEDKEITT
jgi:hypothetical protein